MTYYCGECVMSWHPFQCIDGACPQCGGGTKRTNDPASADADTRHQKALAKRVKRDRYERFETFYAEWESNRAQREVLAAQETGPIDTDAIRRGLDDDDEPEQFGEAA